MKRSTILLALALLTLGSGSGRATTIVGDLNNFDTINDTGQICYGFEIELDDVVSSDITYTFDWNHYGAPKIRQDNTDPAHPKVFIRYESAKDANGNWGAGGSFTNQAIPTLAPPAGHTCTDTSVNEGCEHFGVGYYGTPSAIKYNWLVDGGAGNLVYSGSPVPVAAPRFAYTPPAGAQPAQVVAAIPAPVVPNQAGKEFGEPSWVKVIKTTTHGKRRVALGDLISDDTDGDGRADWQNNEPDEVETEWHLLQANNNNPAKAGLDGGADDMGDGSETVTRRYEFYRYGAAANSLDGENGEAMCDEVDPTTNPNDPNYLHGVGSHVAVTDANGDTYYVDCAAQVVVGTYIGAQMAGFAAAAPLGLIDHLQDGDRGTLYTPRTVVVGGNTPFAITVSNGNLPAGLAIDPLSGVLVGTPTAGGSFSFTIGVTDADNTTVSKAYTMNVTGSEPCAAGSYSATGMAPCTLAPAGSFAAGTGNTSATLCLPGSFSSAPGAAACTLAPAGYYAAGTGNVAATLCPAGTTSPAGASSCTAIAVGQQLSDAIDAALGDRPDLANALHQQAARIASATNSFARAVNLKAFYFALNAQRGNALTDAEADNLFALAKRL